MFRHVTLATLLLLCTSQTPDTASARRLLREARTLLDSARYDIALLRSQAAVEMAPPDSDLSAECLLTLGDVFAEQANWLAAEDQYRAALLFLEKKHGPRHVITALAFNDLGEIFYKKNDIPQAESFHHRALIARQQMHGEQHESVADSYNNLGNCAAAKSNWGEAMSLHRMALRIRQQVLPADHPDLATSHNNLGNCLLSSGDAASALPEFEAALHIRQQAFGSQHPKTAQVLNNLGNCRAALGQRLRAVEYYRLALDIRRRQLGEQHPSLAPPLENLGDLCSDGGDHIAALDFYRQAYLIRAKIDGLHVVPTAVLCHKIGLCHQYEGSYASALTHHLDAARVLVPALGEASPVVAGLWNNIGNCYAAQRDFAQALKHYQRAERAYQRYALATLNARFSILHSPDLALVFNNLGQCYLETRRAHQALSFFVKAENALPAHPTPELADCLKNQALALERLHRWPAAEQALARAQQCAAATDPATAMETQMAEGAMRCRRGLRLGDTSLLQQSLTLLTDALHLSDSLRLGLSAPASRQRWAERQYPALAAAVEAAFRLWHITAEEGFLERAFGFAERSRSLQLLDHLRHEQAERFAGIPDSLLDQERYWGEELNRREKGRRAALDIGDAAEAETAAVAIAEARQQLTQVAQRMEAISPAFARMRYAAGAVSSADVRRLVLRGEERALVEYFRTDDALFVFVVTGQVFRGLRLAVADTLLDEQVRIFRRSVEAYPAATGDVAAVLSEQYARAAHRIFREIIAPVQAAVPLPKEWVLVPDGALSYLPFEALLCELPADFQQFKSHRYLLRDAQISYAYSSTQLVELLSEQPAQAARPLLTIAPTFDGSHWKPLLHNRAEAEAVSDLLGGDVLLGKAATAVAFQQVAGDYRILHLATHGQASETVGERSHLAFSQPDIGLPASEVGKPAFAEASPKVRAEAGKLYARDLYLLRLRAELVVLSACETGGGENRRGEGVVGLTKGFFSAGARSAVATLWSVDDARNADLVLRFFQKLKTGSPKDAALREAKLDYIRARPHDEAHPVCWAAALAYGDMVGMDFSGREFRWWWLAVGVVVVVTLLGLWRWRRRSTMD